jgi:hypothetical protein
VTRAEPVGATAFPVVVRIEAGFGVNAAARVISPQFEHGVAAAPHRAAGRIVPGRAAATFLRSEAGK